MPNHEAGSFRSNHELSSLTPEMIAPLNASELANSHTSGALHGLADRESTKAVELRQTVAELQRQLDYTMALAQDAESRKIVYLEAYELARSIEDGK